MCLFAGVYLLLVTYASVIYTIFSAVYVRASLPGCQKLQMTVLAQYALQLATMCDEL